MCCVVCIHSIVYKMYNKLLYNIYIYQIAYNQETGCEAPELWCEPSAWSKSFPRFLLTLDTSGESMDSFFDFFNSGLLIGVDLALATTDLAGLALAATGPEGPLGIVAFGEGFAFDTTLVGALAGVATGFGVTVPWSQHGILQDDSHSFVAVFFSNFIFSKLFVKEPSFIPNRCSNFCTSSSAWKESTEEEDRAWAVCNGQVFHVSQVPG